MTPAKLPPDTVAVFNVNGRQLPSDATVETCALHSGHAITAILKSGSPPPDAAACAAPYTMLDVEDSELASAAGLLQVAGH